MLFKIVYFYLKLNFFHFSAFYLLKVHSLLTKNKRKKETNPFYMKYRWQTQISLKVKLFKSDTCRETSCYLTYISLSISFSLSNYPHNLVNRDNFPFRNLHCKSSNLVYNASSKIKINCIRLCKKRMCWWHRLLDPFSKISN